MPTDWAASLMMRSALSSPSNSSTLTPEEQILPLKDPMILVPLTTTDFVPPVSCLMRSLKYRCRLSCVFRMNDPRNLEGGLPTSSASIHLSVGSSLTK